MKRKGFTLIELLVVIAIIALLMAIILPSLRAAKELASGAVCVNNQRQLILAWTSYADDNDNFIVGGSNYYNGNNGTPYRWVEYPLLQDTDNPEVTGKAAEAQYTLDTRKNGIRAGQLFAYTGDEDLYHCPGDRNITKTEPKAIFRSYAITGLMNGEHFVNHVTSSIYSPIKDYAKGVKTPGGAAETLYVVIKTTQVNTPGNKFVFVEEDCSRSDQSSPLGSFVLLGGSNFDWWDAPANYHNGSSTFGFADGHAERHRWQDPDTVRKIEENITDPEPTTNEDLIWLARNYLPK